MKLQSRFFLLSILLFLFQQCARKGRPEGGPKDEDAPIMLVAKPANESVNFKDNSIRIYFDEYVTLKDLNKQLIVSPPFKNPPLITPQGTPSKYINIKILDTLKENTTYTFNFGNAIQDNNEGNKIENFKYVLSTGNLIDSLTIKGAVRDIEKKLPTKNYSLLLYKLDSTYNDSIVYKEKPNYVTRTIDSTNYKFTNIGEGEYAIFAIDEEVSNYKFDPKTDKIGFLNTSVFLPKDSIIDSDMVLFSELLPYKLKRGKQTHKGKIQFGYTGKQTNMKVRLLSNTPKNFKFYTKFEEDKDTLNYWYAPIDIKADSLNFIISNKNVIDTATVFLRKKKLDSLSISSSVKGNLHLTDTLFLKANNPIIKVDEDKFSLMKSDSIPVEYELKKHDINTFAIFFEKEIKTPYTLQVLPEAFQDLYDVKSKDTLNYKFNTKDIEDYGTIFLDVKKKFDNPVIIEVLAKDELIRTQYVETSKTIEFKLLEPRQYVIRAIIDDNKNGVWDTGNLLKKQQPEKIIYFSQKLKVRANWSFNETFTIE